MTGSAVSCAEAKLTTLRRGIERCRKCRLAEERQRAVPGEGPADAQILFLGEAPGTREDTSGRPFCGRAGAFFDEMLECAGLARDAVFLTSCVKCRPPQNRRPRRDELATCRAAWLERQIDVIDPALIVLLGGTAVRVVLGDARPLHALHGHPVARKGRLVYPTYNPAAGMRFPKIASKMRDDFAQLCGSGHLPLQRA